MSSEHRVPGRSFVLLWLLVLLQATAEADYVSAHPRGVCGHTAHTAVLTATVTLAAASLLPQQTAAQSQPTTTRNSSSSNSSSSSSSSSRRRSPPPPPPRRSPPKVSPSPARKADPPATPAAVKPPSASPSPRAPTGSAAAAAPRRPPPRASSSSSSRRPPPPRASSSSSRRRPPPPAPNRPPPASAAGGPAPRRPPPPAAAPPRSSPPPRSGSSSSSGAGSVRPPPAAAAPTRSPPPPAPVRPRPVNSSSGSSNSSGSGTRPVVVPTRPSVVPPPPAAAPGRSPPKTPPSSNGGQPSRPSPTPAAPNRSPPGVVLVTVPRPPPPRAARPRPPPPRRRAPPPKPPPPSPPPPSPPPPSPPPPPPPPPPNRRYCTANGSTCCLPAGSASCPVCTGRVTGALTSLWGCRGQAANASLAAGHLYDWSYAGYAAGDALLPALTVSANIKSEFGAVGDGVADDSSPFLEAIRYVRNRAVIYIPPGTYKITRQLIIPSRIILRGAGQGRTILHFPMSLSRWVLPVPRDDGDTVFTHGNAWIQFEGIDAWNTPDNFLANVTRPAALGDTRLWVSNSSAFSVGQWVLLSVDDAGGGLAAALARWQWEAAGVSVEEGYLRLATPITAVGNGYITIQRVLPFDLPLTWRPRLWTTAGYRRTLCGLESLTISMAWSPYRGLGTEAGWNAVIFAQTQHSWVKDVEVVNSDVPLLLRGVSHFTVSGLTVNVTRPRNTTLNQHGSRAVWLKGGTDVLITNLTVATRYAFDISLSGAAVGTVVSKSRGADLGVLQEGRGPFATLLTQVNFGRGTRPFLGGRPAATSGAFTVWNCWASDTGDGAVPPPGELYSVKANLIGTRLLAPPVINRTATWRTDASTMGAWRDVLAAPVSPENIHDALLSIAPFRGWAPAAGLSVIRSGVLQESGGSSSGVVSVSYGCTPSGSICCFLGGTRPVTPECPQCPAAFGLPSALFGCQGELWRPAGRLPDFSFAGYMAGEAALPSNQPIVANLKTDFGAVGDGVTDDTDAFMMALNTVDAVPPRPSPSPSPKPAVSPVTPPAVKPPASTPTPAVQDIAAGAAPATASRTAPAEDPYASASALNALTRTQEAATPSSSSSTPAAGGVVSPAGGLGVGGTGISLAGFLQQLFPLPGNLLSPKIPASTAGEFRIQSMAEPVRGGGGSGVVMSGDWPVALTTPSNPSAKAAAPRVTPSSATPGGTNPSLLTFLQKTAAASAAAAASQAAAQLPNRTLTARFGSKQSAVYATWDLDPTYTLLLDPKAVPAVRGQLGQAPLPQMFADTHTQNADAEVVTSPAAAAAAAAGGGGKTTPKRNSSSSSSKVAGSGPTSVARALLQQQGAGSSEGAAGVWDLEEGGSTMLPAAGAAGAWSRPAGAAGSDWRLDAGSDGSQQQQQQQHTEHPTPTTTTSSSSSRSSSSKAHRRLLQTNSSLSQGVQNGVLYIPPGTYVLKKRLDMRRPNLVIRGAGKDRTTIYIPVSLSEVYGNSLHNGTSSVSDWSHSTGFINFFGWDPIVPWNRIAVVTRPAVIGDTRLFVNNATAFRGRVGQLVRFTMDGNITSLLADMAGGFTTPGPGQLSSNAMGRVYRLLTRVTAVGPDWVQIERPLTANVSLEWAPRFHEFQPQISSSGIEDLTIRFKWKPYRGHLQEDGYNAIHFNQLANSWVRNVRIINADAGVYFWGTQHCTVTGVELAVTQSRATPVCNCGNQHGHRGVWMERGADNLVTRFNVSMPMVHDITVSWTEQHSVVVDGTGQDVNFDHHRNLPYANLFTAVDQGRGARPYESSGSEPFGTHAGSFTTFWGNYGRLGYYYPAVLGGPQTPGIFGPLINFVGQKSFEPAPAGWSWWSEELWPQLHPPNLYAAMVATRAARLNTTTTPAGPVLR